MKVIICGAGQVGYGIAEHLASEGNDIAVIDTSEELVQRISDTLDVRGFVGHGAHPDILEQAGAQEADMIIAVTFYDEVNMIACQVAHSLFNIRTKVARIRDGSYREKQWEKLFNTESIPIDVVISPETEVADMILRRLTIPGAFESVEFFDGKVSLLGISCDAECPILNTPLRQLTELFPDLGAVVIGIYRNGIISTPHAEDPLMEGDDIYVVVSASQIRRTLKIFGHVEKQAQRVVIAGGGNIGLSVAERLENRSSKTRIKIVEHNRDQAIEIASYLKRTVIINGSALDEDILREVDVARTDLMVALTNDDQVNILSSVLAKNIGCKRNLCLINSKSYMPIVRSIGIDAHLNPRTITISKVLQYVRRGHISNVHTIQNGSAEVVQGKVSSLSTLSDRSLKDIELSEGMRIGAILRNAELIELTGSTVIKAGDSVVMFVTAENIKDVEEMFSASE